MFSSHVRVWLLPEPSVATARHWTMLLTPPEFEIVIVSPRVVVLHDCEDWRVPSDFTLKHRTLSIVTDGLPQVSVAVAVNETGAEGGGIVAGVGR